MPEADQPPQAAQTTQSPPAPAGEGQAVALDLPERPALAPNVALRGAMEESGFKEQQWLVQRDGRFIQITELLYRVAEQADGRRTLTEMAAAVSQATGRKVSADNVRQLLVQKLIPLGIVAQADGAVASHDGTAGQVPARSPLAVNMKMAMISPRVIDPLTRVLQVLYYPPVLLGALLAAFAAQGWMLFVHGVAGSVRDALYAPGLLLAALAIIVVGAAFHEFGHAAALRYGGGQVRGMGAGIYLIYPAFYTDVSDNYRLGRWARVRTDLGGFYFNLIFALGIMALYAVTGSEFLLIVVVMMDFDIIRQSMPFVRLDGYWTLADLTGIPDFFSNMAAFVRTVVPIPGWKGRKLPDLKGWVKVVYALYILITVPLLLFLLFVTIKSVPRVLATAWDSFGELAGDFSGARGDRDFLGMAAAVVQMLTLALPTLATLFMLFALGRNIFGALWNWSRPTPARRVAGLLASVGVVALVAFLWAPQLPSFLPARGGRPGPLYGTTSFRPITENERGRLSDAAAGAPIVGNLAGTRVSSPSPTPTPTPTTTRSPTATATATPVSTATRVATAAATTTVAATRAATGTPRPVATVGPAATPAR